MPGNLPDLMQVRSPNYGPRKHGLPPDMVVLHYTAMETADAACERLCDEMAEVSAHYVISEQGDITQLVSEDMRAWHAGAGAWGAVKDVNSHSIGIELANAGSLYDMPPFPHPQMQALRLLLSGILKRWHIPAERVIGHSDMAPDRKFDPGAKFDWQGLALDGLSIWPDRFVEITASWDLFKQEALLFGYRPPEDTQAGWEHVLSAFRMRFFPTKQGTLDSDDMVAIMRLAKKWPCAVVDLGKPI